MKLPHWIRYLILVEKIRARLPNYHSESGQRMSWGIEPGYYRDIAYDPVTGKTIRKRFVPRPRIRQRAPRMIIDQNVYNYCWYRQSIEGTLAIWA